jgi:hypothetical protein
MRSIVTKILGSGLIDKHTALLLEKWGCVPVGKSITPISEEAMRERLTELVEDLASVLEQDYVLKETSLDLDTLKWPTRIEFIIKRFASDRKVIAGGIPALIDKAGNLYVRVQDVSAEWFVPGYIIERECVSLSTPLRVITSKEEILECDTLYLGDDPICHKICLRDINNADEK